MASPQHNVPSICLSTASITCSELDGAFASIPRGLTSGIPEDLIGVQCGQGVVLAGVEFIDAIVEQSSSRPK